MTRILIIALLATIAVSYVFANDLNLGGPVPNDHSVRNATVIRKPRHHHQKAIVALGDGSNITSIRAVNHNAPDNATVRILVGGLGHRGVLLSFEAPKRQGLNYTVEVRGVRPPKPTPPPPTTRPPPPPPPTTSDPEPPTSDPEPPTTTPAEEQEEVEEEIEESSILQQVYFADN